MCVQFSVYVVCADICVYICVNVYMCACMYGSVQMCGVYVCMCIDVCVCAMYVYVFQSNYHMCA